MSNTLQRGDVLLIDLGYPNGSVQGGMRPAIVIQNNIGNQFSPTVLVVPMTSQINNKPYMPTHAFIPANDGGLRMNSLALAEQIQTVNKSQAKTKIGTLSAAVLRRVEAAVKVSLAL